MRRMADSVTAANCPGGFDLYAGYIDGQWPSALDLERTYPGRVVRITVTGGRLDAHMIDVENGDATPAGALAWCRAKRARGDDPSVYANLATWPELEAVFNQAGEPLPHWCAAGYRNPPRPYMAAGAVATQWVDWGPYDESLVDDYWPGIDPPDQENPVQPTDIVDVHVDGPNCWQLQASGAVDTRSGPFWGSPLGEPPDVQAGFSLPFRAITARRDGQPGYTCWDNTPAHDGYTYGADHHPGTSPP